MRASYSNVVIAALLAFPLLAGHGAAAKTLRVGGSGGFLVAIQQISGPYKAATGVDLEVIAGLGTAGAMRALGDGVIDVVFAAREPNPNEVKVRLLSPAFARTPLVFVTSHPKPNGLRSGDIPEIFTSLDPKWEDGTPLRIIIRTKVDADTVLVGWLLPGLARAIERARARADVPVAATDQDNVAIAQRLNGSLTIAGYGQIIAEKCDLRFIAIDGIAPSLATLTDGSYPYEKKFYLVFAADRSADAEQLLRFLRSPEAGKILLAIGYLPFGE